MKEIEDKVNETLLVMEFVSNESGLYISNPSQQLNKFSKQVIDHNTVQAYKTTLENGQIIWDKAHFSQLSTRNNDKQAYVQINGYEDDRNCKENDFILVVHYNKNRCKWHKMFYRIQCLTENEVILEYMRHHYEFNSVNNVNNAMMYVRNEPKEEEQLELF